MSKNINLLYVAGVGPLIVTIQSETADAIIVSNPCQFGLDENNNLVVRDYLDGISNPEKNVTFMKYSIISISDPHKTISDVYISALENIKNSGIYMPPEKKIIT